MDNRFRSAAFGGFNRQDVMDYLERSVKEQNQALEQANAQRIEARNEADQLREQMAQLREEVRQAKEELERITVDQQTAQEQSDRLEELRLENEQLRLRANQAQADAEAYAAIKERTASIELEAHRRAQTIVDEAQVQAEQVRRELGQWLERVERDYYDLRAQVGTTTTQAASELERVRKGLDNVTLCMNSQHSALERLMQTAKNSPAGNE